MISFILSKADFCPACGRRSVSISGRRCGRCRAKLFYPHDNFSALRADLVESYWVFFKIKTARGYEGWVHSTHLLREPQPATPEDKIPELPPENYGKQPLPAGCSDK